MLFFYYFQTTIYIKIIFVLFNKIFTIRVGGVIEKATTSHHFKSVALILEVLNLDRRYLGTETF